MNYYKVTFRFFDCSAIVASPHDLDNPKVNSYARAVVRDIIMTMAAKHLGLPDLFNPAMVDISRVHANETNLLNA